MHILITAGPTRESIDSVRFITNGSSGQMGCAVAKAALEAGHRVTLLLGEGARAAMSPAAGLEVVPFVTVDDLRRELTERFTSADVLVMAAAVGDFWPERVLPTKLSRRGGPITLRLVPTEDLLAGVGATKKPTQRIVAFAVEDGLPDEIQAKARAEMLEKNADFVVVNTPAAMAASHSTACILTREGVAMPWDDRPKETLAEDIVNLLSRQDDSVAK